MPEAGLRRVKLWEPRVEMEKRADGTFIVQRADPLGPYPDRITDRLVHWAKATPERPWLAQRAAGGEWRLLTYAEGLDRVRRAAQAFIARDLSAERPLLILSGNDIEHALMALGAQYAGVPSAAVSTAYSLRSKDFSKLRDIVRQLTPGMVFASEGAAYRNAIEATIDPDVPVVSVRNPLDRRQMILFEELLESEPDDSVDRAHVAVGPDTVAKFLFTSGTTGSPKAVIQTQRMLCANQEMVANCYAFVRDEPPILVDWAPWNHTASGNKVFNFALYNGGAYYIDGGTPSPAGIGETIRNLKDVSPTWYFNVPAGYELLVDAMERDALLRQNFFRRLKLLMYAGAGMAQHTWQRLSELAVETVGERVLLATGLGSTETAPFALFCTEEQESPGNVGIPAPGVTLKLTPAGDKLEARLKGPNITPGYWRDPKLTAEAFDEEGFYKLGDALRFAVPFDAAKGFLFDGRLAENFKLRTGTWVHVGALRAKLVNEFGGLVRDAVIAGEDRDELGALLLPFMPALRELIPNGAKLNEVAVVAHPRIRGCLRERLSMHAAGATGSASRVVRVLVMEREPSIDKGEVTDKGSLNQRAMLRHNADLIEALFSDDARVIGLS
ncbi:MAG: feruloyl-CoA synthase [Propylenella sp.]